LKHFEPQLFKINLKNKYNKSPKHLKKPIKIKKKKKVYKTASYPPKQSGYFMFLFGWVLNPK
jgi:hypothetical protein